MGMNAGNVNCPACGFYFSIVRNVAGRRRRRRCHKCSHRFTTYEVNEADMKIFRAVEVFLNSAKDLK